MPTLYLRVSDQAKNYVAGIARAAGISESRAAELVLLRAESRGWTIAGLAVVEYTLDVAAGVDPLAIPANRIGGDDAPSS